MHHPPRTGAQFICTRENRSAFLAVQELAETLAGGAAGTHKNASGKRFPKNRNAKRTPNPLYLFGPPGTGKTHLVSRLAQQVIETQPNYVVGQLSSNDFTAFRENLDNGDGETADGLFGELEQCDLLIVEDIQHLHPKAMPAFTELMDRMNASGQTVVITGNTGPKLLKRGKKRFPARLVSRLSGGLIVGLEPLGSEGRLQLLQENASHLRLSDEILSWLAEHMQGGARQLLGAVKKIALLKAIKGSLDLNSVIQLFHEQDEKSQLTMEHIAVHVCAYFELDPKQLCSRQRIRSVMIPRQVGMYLARKLTESSLQQIGDYFGGRDHTTVLHACRKVENSLDEDVTISGAVHDLQAELI